MSVEESSQEMVLEVAGYQVLHARVAKLGLFWKLGTLVPAINIGVCAEGLDDGGSGHGAFVVGEEAVKADEVDAVFHLVVFDPPRT